jgi:hypothetical protein
MKTLPWNFPCLPFNPSFLLAPSQFYIICFPPRFLPVLSHLQTTTFGFTVVVPLCTALSFPSRFIFIPWRRGAGCFSLRLVSFYQTSRLCFLQDTVFNIPSLEPQITHKITPCAMNVAKLDAELWCNWVPEPQESSEV